MKQPDVQSAAHGARPQEPQIEGPVLHSLVARVLQAMDQSDPASDPSIEHIVLAVRARLAVGDGQAAVARARPRGGLAPWQERRAKDLLEAHLDGSVSIDEIAQACRLSVSYFVRAFKQSTGLPPHQWLIQRRVYRAKELLRGSSLSLAEVALECGFADQSHFSRVFGQRAGTTPGGWRRWVAAGR